MQERHNGFLTSWISEFKRRLRLRDLFRRLDDSPKSLTLAELVEVFALAELRDWYGPNKENRVRKPWAVQFGDQFVLTKLEEQAAVIGQIAQLSPRQQADFLAQLYELDPPQGERDTGTWRKDLAQALWQPLDEKGQKDFASVIRASSFVPSEVKQIFDIPPPAVPEITIGTIPQQ